MIVRGKPAVEENVTVQGAAVDSSTAAQRGIAVPPSLNVTVSPLAGSAPDGPLTVAVNVTGSPTVDGFWEDVMVVVVSPGG